ncbi:hypothetical protein QJS66_00980 [Kocuria rhizophila]|nr:hypothetical protein QJS66_00980 [Kocuria rhizophila]
MVLLRRGDGRRRSSGRCAGRRACRAGHHGPGPGRLRRTHHARRRPRPRPGGSRRARGHPGRDVYGGHRVQGGATEAAGNLEIMAPPTRPRGTIAALETAARRAAEAARSAEQAEQRGRRPGGAARPPGTCSVRRGAAAAGAASSRRGGHGVVGGTPSCAAPGGAHYRRGTACRRAAELDEALRRAESVDRGRGEPRTRAARGRRRAQPGRGAAKAAREAETQARLALRGLEEQHRHIVSRAEAGRHAPRAPSEAACAEAARRAERRRVQAAVARAVETAAAHLRAARRRHRPGRPSPAEWDEIETRRAGLDEAAQRLRTERDRVDGARRAHGEAAPRGAGPRATPRQAGGSAEATSLRSSG